MKICCTHGKVAVEQEKEDDGIGKYAEGKEMDDMGQGRDATGQGEDKDKEKEMML